mgnify:CR=1 FL=1
MISNILKISFFAFISYPGAVCAKSSIDPITKNKIEYGIKRTGDIKKVASQIAGSTFISNVSIKSKSPAHFQVEVVTFDFDSPEDNLDKVRRASVFAIVSSFASSTYDKVILTFVTKRQKDFVNKKQAVAKTETYAFDRKAINDAVSSLLSKFEIIDVNDLLVNQTFEGGEKVVMIAPEYDKLIYNSETPGLTKSYDSFIQTANSPKISSVAPLSSKSRT